MPFRKRLKPLLAVAASFLTIAPSASSEAQIWHPYPYPYGYRFDAGGSVRLEVKPKEAEVYVDGYYAGVVDDFDGMFQRLRVAPGEHEITLYRDGYRPVIKRVYLMPDRTFRIKQTLEPLAPGEANPPRPTPAAPPAGAYPPPRPSSPGAGRIPSPPNGPPGAPPALPPSGESATGTLAVRVQPTDAEVLIDGQPVSSGDEVVVDVPEGRHAVQIRKTGYVGYLTEVQVRRGETTTLNVTLKTRP